MRKRTPQQLVISRPQASKSEMQSLVLNPNTRLPSPTSRPSTPDSYSPSDAGEQQLYISEESESGSAITFYTGKDTLSKSPGIRYITENLIKKLTKQEQLGTVHSLNLCLSKAGGKKFKFIENLEKCDHLLVLNLNNNMIEKIEKLNRQLKLRELSLSYNRICKIEGLEHMVNLQNLMLAGNYIEQIPAWVGKKLRSLRVLNLKQNNITSLQDVVKLKSLKELTSLILTDNPLASLPHYRPYIIYHLRSLNCLDGRPVTFQERQEAHERFHLEELENLEKELERKVKEIELLEQKQTKAMENIKTQEQLNKSLQLEHQQQKKNCQKLEREVETKNELLKQKAAELTRACHKHYQLEQELAFYKIDAKFEPLHQVPTENFGLEEIPNESPYIGKARYKRNQCIQEEHIVDPVQHGNVGKIQFDVDDEGKNKMRVKLNPALDVQLEDKEKKIQKAEEALKQLQGEKEKTQQQVLRTAKELKNLEELTAQKQISEVEKEQLKRELAQKIQLINHLRQEAEKVEQQLERQWKEMEKKQHEIFVLEKNLKSINPKDPQHAHLKAQMLSKAQQLDMMSKQFKRLEKHLDEMLSRIAQETESIKDLEEQLTEGQIAANETLKRDLESIIAGLQEYLESVKGQAKQAREECTKLREECSELQKEKEALLHRLVDMEQQKNQLEIVAMDADNLRRELSALECSLQEQRELNESLRQAQGDLSEYEAELESQLQARDIEANQFREELERLQKLSQMEQSALQAELEKERQALENALAQAQLVAEKEHENKKLDAQLKNLLIDNSLLKEQFKELQMHMNQAIKTMIHPEEVSAHISELRRKLDSGVQDVRPYNQGDILGRNLAELQKQLNEILRHSQQEKEEVLCHCKRLEQEIMTLQDELKNTQDNSKKAEALLKSEKGICQVQAQQLKDKIASLQEQLRNMQELQAVADEQLQGADEDRDKLLQELEDKENKNKMEDAETHLKLCNLEKEVKDLKATMAASDKMAARELSTAKGHLKALQGTVQKLNQERTEEMKAAEKFQAEATRAARGLAKAEAEIELLQNLLKDKENQILDEMQTFDFGANSVNIQHFEIERLSRALDRQQAEVKRLQDHLNRTREGNINEMKDLMDEISALRNDLGDQNDYITSMMDPFKRRGYWCVMPFLPKPPSLRSQNSHAKDSGFSSLHQVPPSPSQGSLPRRGEKEESSSSVPGGYWVYSPIKHTSQSTRIRRGDDEDSGTESDENGTPKQMFIAPPKSVIYTMYPDATPLPQGTVVYGPPPTQPANVRPVSPGTIIYGPPPPGTQVVYGPPPANFTIPLIPDGVLHCNVQEHHDLENEVSKLEDIIAHLRAHKSKDPKTTASIDHREQIEQFRHDIQELLHEREELEHEVEELHKVVHKRTNQKDFLDGHIDLLMNELEVEKSSKRHDDIVDEIECVEITLTKRRAELREADRLLMEAEADLKSTREKSKEILQRYDDARKHLVDTEKDAEELEQRAHDTAVKLVKADEQLRLMKNALKDLEQHKAEQEHILKKINQEVSTGNLELQILVQKMENMTERLEKLQAEIVLAETKEKQHLETLKEAAILLEDKKSELESLNSKVKMLREELIMLDRCSEKKKEELNFLQNEIDKKKASLSEVLLRGEAEMANKQRQIRELKALLEEMSAQKGELNAQITEKNSCLSLSKQEVKNEEEKLQSIQEQINKQRTELKLIVEMVQLENDELLGLKQQHEKKIMELERTQAVLREGKSELENLQLVSQGQQAEIKYQKQRNEKDRQEADQLTTKKNSLRNSIKSLDKEKKHIGENCLALENTLSQAKRAVEATEESNRSALSKLQKLQTEMSEMNQEINQIKIQKQELNQKTAHTQNCLQEEKAELEKLRDNFRTTKDQLQLAEQELQNVTKKCDMLKTEQLALKENVNRSASKYQSSLENENKKEQELLQIQKQIEKKQHELTEQQKMLQCVKKDVKCEEIKLEQSSTKVKDQIQALEAELTDKKNELEQVIAKVNMMEEKSRKMQHNEEQCIVLEDQIVILRHQLSDQQQQHQQTMDELAFLQKEIKFSKNNVTHLQQWIHSERKKAEKQVAVITEESKAQKAQLEKALNEQKYENNRLRKELSSRDQVAHDDHAQAERIRCELNEIKRKYFELKQQMRSQEQMEQRQKEIKEATIILRSDVKAEIGNSLKDLDQSCEELKYDLGITLEGPESLQHEMESLKENFPFAANERRYPIYDERLRLTKFNFKDEQWRGEVLRENLRQQEDRLKAQIRQCMSEQAEALCHRKQQTEGNLTSLRRRVDALDELVTSMSVNSFQQYQTSLNDGPNKTPLHTTFQSPSRRPSARSLKAMSSHLLVTEPPISEKDSDDIW